MRHLFNPYVGPNRHLFNLNRHLFNPVESLPATYTTCFFALAATHPTRLATYSTRR